MKKTLEKIGFLSLVFFTLVFINIYNFKAEGCANPAGNCGDCHVKPATTDSHHAYWMAHQDTINCAYCHAGPFTPVMKDCNTTGCHVFGGQQDTTPPVTTVNLNGALDINGWYVSDVTVEFTASDSGSGVKEIHYRINDRAEVVVSGNYASTILTYNDDHNITCFAVDNDGNRETASTITVIVNKAQSINLAGIHHVLPDAMSNCATCHDFMNQTPTCSSNCHRIIQDNTPPVTSVNPVGTPGDNNCYVSDVSVHLSASDYGSGVKEIHYSINSGAETIISGIQTSINLTANGEYNISYFAVDNSNNQENLKTLSIVINKVIIGDNTPPFTTAAVTGTQDSNGRYISDVNVEFTAIDDQSGVKEIHYSVNGGQEIVFVPVNSTAIFGDYKLGMPVSLGSNINTVYNDGHPALTVDGNTMYFQSDRPGGYGNMDLYVSYRENGVWQPAENLGGVINTGGEECGPCISPDGNTLYFTSGGRGNGDVPYYYTRVWKSVKANGVWRAPVVLSGNVNVSSINNNTGFISKDGKWLYWNSFGVGFGMWDAYRSDISSGEPLPAEHLPSPINSGDRDGPVYLTADSRYFVSWSDRPGSSSHYVSEIINGNYEAFRQFTYPFLYFLGTMAENETIAYLASNQSPMGMGGDDIFYAPVNRGSSNSIILSDDGVHNIEYYAVDNAGNIEEAKTLTVNINKTADEDTVPPTTSANVTGTKGDGDWYVSDVSVKFSATDSQSGVKEIHYSINGAQEVVCAPDNFSAVFGDYKFGPPVSLGQNVNSPYPEGHPSVTSDGNYLYFWSRRPGGCGGDDIYVSRRIDGVWQPAENLGSPVNTSGDEGEPVISPDGNVLYFTSCYGVPPGYTRIWKSVNENGVWQEPVVLPSNVNLSGINNNLGFITPDGRWLYWNSFGVGFGMWDAYRAEIINNGETFNVEHLPSPVNTVNRDGPIYLTADGKYLILWSDRTGIFPHYVSEIINGVYQNPVRLVYPFSEAYALGTLTENETMAYLVSFQSADYLHASDPGEDIYCAPVIKGSSASVSLTGDGIYDILYYAVDNTGNTGEPNTLTIQIAKAPPVTSAVVNGTLGNNGWYMSDVTVNLTADGFQSGIREIRYSLNSGEEIVQIGNQAVINLVSDGSYNISYYAVNSAGVSEELKSVVVKIDKTAPVITVYALPEANANGWNNSDVSVMFNAEDNLSDIGSVMPQVTVTSEGANQTVTGTAEDLAGNTASVSIGLNIDKTPPVINGCADVSFIETEPVILPVITVNDNLDSNPAITINVPSLYPVGTTTVAVSVSDKAGNISTSSLDVTVITVENADTRLKDMINGLSSSSFKNNAANSKNALTNKINALINIIGAAKSSTDPAVQDSLFSDAIAKLKDDIQKKMDGCGASADNNDWIIDCVAQSRLNALINKILVVLNNLKAN